MSYIKFNSIDDGIELIQLIEPEKEDIENNEDIVKVEKAELDIEAQNISNSTTCFICLENNDKKSVKLNPIKPQQPEITFIVLIIYED